MRKFFSLFFQKTRTLRVRILTLFLALIAGSFLSVISFVFIKDYRFVLDASKDVADSVSEAVLEQFRSIGQRSERIVGITAGFFDELGPINVENKRLTSYLLNVLKYDVNFSNFYIGLPDGSFCEAFSQRNAPQKNYMSDPSTPLPDSIVFSLMWIDKSQDPSVEEFHYFNDQFELVTTERVPKVDYDPRNRPWYEGAAQARAVYWTPFYPFFPTGELGITIANPVYNAAGKLEAIIGADMSVTLLSTLLANQKVGKTGQAFILSKTGEIIVPPEDHSADAILSKKLTNRAYNRFSQGTSQGDPIYTQNGIHYLVYISQLPAFFGKEWLIATISPLSDYFSNFITMQKQVVVLMVVILLISAIIVAYFAKRISSPIVVLAHEVNKITQLELGSEVRVSSNIKEIYLMDAAIVALRQAIRSFAKYVPREIVKDLFHRGKEISLGGEKKELTIFFSDITGFTSIAESCPIDVLSPLLSEYFEALTTIILKAHGTIDKFIGDGIMAFWGAPLDIPDHADRACLTALRCQALLVTLNRKRKEGGNPEFFTRIGVNTGTVTVGNIGTYDRMNYTVMGDAVNITARLQETDKIYHTLIIISEDTYKKLKGQFLVRPLDVVAVKGKTAKIKIYELIACMSEERELLPTPEQVELCRASTEAYEAFARKEYDTARALFQDILHKFPEDFPTRLHLDRIEEELRS